METFQAREIDVIQYMAKFLVRRDYLSLIQIFSL